MSTSIVLVCAVAASLGAGVLLAYGVCYAMFAIFRIHAQQVAVRSLRIVSTPQVAAEG